LNVKSVETSATNTLQLYKNGVEAVVHVDLDEVGGNADGITVEDGSGSGGSGFTAYRSTTAGSTTARFTLRQENDYSWFDFRSTTGNTNLHAGSNNDGFFSFSVLSSSVQTEIAQLKHNGDFEIDGSFISSDTTINTPDYVFDDEYERLPFQEHFNKAKKEKSLPFIPTALELKEGGYNVITVLNGVIEELELLYYYVEELENKIEVLKKKASK